MLLARYVQVVFVPPQCKMLTFSPVARHRRTSRQLKVNRAGSYIFFFVSDVRTDLHKLANMVRGRFNLPALRLQYTARRGARLIFAIFHYIRTHARTHTHAYAQARTRTHIRKHAHTHARMHARTPSRACAHTSTSRCSQCFCINRLLLGHFFTTPLSSPPPPDAFIQISKQGRKWQFSSKELSNLNLRCRDSLEEIFMLTSRYITTHTRRCLSGHTYTLL